MAIPVPIIGEGPPISEECQEAAVGSIYTDAADPDHPVQWKKTTDGITVEDWVEEIAGGYE